MTIRIVTACEACGSNKRVVKPLHDLWVCDFCKPLVVETNVFQRFYTWYIEACESLTNKIDAKLMNAPVVVHAAKQLVNQVVANVFTLAEVTRRTVRLYVIEGEHLSMKGGEKKRLTWYTHPEEARVIGEYMGRLTGRLVYVDLELDCTSDYSHRFYKRGHEAYTLQGDLIKQSKNRWKYFDERSYQEVAITVED